MLAVHPTKRFCVYAHSIDGIVFYVGRGRLARAFATSRRNKQWRVKVISGYDVEIIEWHDTTEAAELSERKLIADLRPECNVIYFDAEAGIFRNPEARRTAFAVGLAARGRAHNLGRKLSPERCLAMSNRLTGKKLSADAYKRQAERMKELRAAGRLFGTKAKPVRCVETGVVYPSMTAAARAVDVWQDGIAKATYRTDLTAGGFHWEFVVDMAANSEEYLPRIDR